MGANEVVRKDATRVVCGCESGCDWGRLGSKKVGDARIKWPAGQRGNAHSVTTTRRLSDGDRSSACEKRCCTAIGPFARPCKS